MFPGKESPWSVLGLESATATVRDVKRAYAKLLKQNRPDADPEGFRRVHDAYTTLLHELELREQEGGAPQTLPAAHAEPVADILSFPAPQRPATPDTEWPAPFAAAVEKLRTAPDAASAPEILTELRLACGGNPVLWREWGKALTGILDTVPSAAALAAAVPVADVLSALRAGSGDAAVRILDLWHSERRLPNMIALGQALTVKEVFQDYDHPVTGFFALRLAFGLAIAQPGGANLLIDAAFSWLPPGTRSQAMAPVENRLNIGRIFWHIPAVWQRFWERALDELDSGGTPDWTTPDARRAISELLRVTPADWPGWGFLKSQLKELQWQAVVEHFNSRPLSRRGWTAPPDRTWINPPASPTATALPFQTASNTRGNRLEEDDDWSIPEMEMPEDNPLLEPLSKTGDASPEIHSATPLPPGTPRIRRRTEPTAFQRALARYYTIPRSVRILLLCVLTWAIVFGIAYLVRVLPRWLR